jgi:hypothetical protein
MEEFEELGAARASFARRSATRASSSATRASRPAMTA